jgi:hypothetical protein
MRDDLAAPGIDINPGVAKSFSAKNIGYVVL